MHLAFTLPGQLSAAYAAKRSITAKRRMSVYPVKLRQTSLRSFPDKTAAWLNSYENIKKRVRSVQREHAFRYGLKQGFPIGLGYFPVSFTFGLLTVAGGLPVWAGILISLTNLTSAGQFAGMNLILAGAGYGEIGLTTLVINLRYMLMSLALSQKIDGRIPVWQRLIFAFGITDETFVVASMQRPPIKAGYMFGLILLPVAGWNLGTICGCCISSILPQALQNAMGIALYAMFIALIVPAARDSLKVCLVIIVAVAVTCILKYVPVFAFVSSGFRIIIATVAAAALGAWLFPKPEEDGETAGKDEIVTADGAGGDQA